MYIVSSYPKVIVISASSFFKCLGFVMSSLVLVFTYCLFPFSPVSYLIRGSDSRVFWYLSLSVPCRITSFAFNVHVLAIYINNCVRSVCWLVSLTLKSISCCIMGQCGVEWRGTRAELCKLHFQVLGSASG